MIDLKHLHFISKLLIIGALLLWVNNCYATTVIKDKEYPDSLVVIEVDSSLLNNVEEFINDEKKCPYYNDEMVFILSIVFGSDTTISLSSFYDRSIEYSNTHRGGLIVKNHLVIVSCRDSCNEMLKRGNSFIYNVYSSPPITDELVFEDEDGEDPRHSQRTYLYSNGTITLHPIFKSYYCN